MRAVRFYGKRDVRLEDVPEPPRSLGPREALVRPKLCGICGTDLHEYVEGAHVIPTKPHALNGSMVPQIIGHEMSAEVIEVGSEVTTAKPGDRVAVMPLLTCGKCHFCRRGLNHLCSIQACTGLSAPWGGFAEYCVVPDYQLNVLPDNVTWEQGAVVETAAVGAYAVDRGGVTGGENVLIAGAGPIGALAALYAMALGAGNVWVSEPNPIRRKIVQDLGVTEAFDPINMEYEATEKREAGSGLFDAAKSPLVAALRDLTGGLGVDVAIDCTGTEAGLASCINAVRTRGRVVESALHVKPPVVDMYSMVWKDACLVGTWAYDIHEWPRYLRLIATGRFPIEKVVTDKISLEHIVDKGFEVLIDPKGSATKILAYPEPDQQD